MALARLQMGSLDGDEDGGSWQLNEALESPGADTYDTRESSLADRVEAMSREKEEATKVRVRGIMERALQDPFTKNRKVILLKADKMELDHKLILDPEDIKDIGKMEKGKIFI